MKTLLKNYCRINLVFILFALGIMLPGSLKSQMPTNGLVAYYMLNGSPIDAGVNALHGVPGAAITSATDRFGVAGYALSFDGVTQDISVPSNVLLNFTNSFSLCGWFNTTTKPDQTILCKGKSGSEIGYALSLNGNTGTVFFTLNTGIPVIASYTSAAYKTGWHFAVGTYNGTELKLYIDGELKETVACSIILNNSSQNLYIGRETNNNSRLFSGMLDDIRIYNRPLTEEEIGLLYHEGGWPTLNTGLVAYYPFNGNANDESGNGNNGTVNGATLTSDRFGNTGKAFHFNGTNNWIQVAHNSDLQPIDQMTVSAWVKPDAFYPGQWGGNFVICKGSDLQSGTYNIGYSSLSHTSVFNLRTDAGATGVGSPVQINTGNWYHMVGIYQNNRIKYYLNGILQGYSVVNGTFPLNNSDLMIGRSNSTTDCYWINGDIDDVRIYNRALLPEEVTALYNEAPLSFNCSTGNMTDHYGNAYNRQQIGNQCWMKENLKATKFNDGTAIPNVKNSASWSNLTGSAYAHYNNDSITFAGTYGVLYNWYAVNDSKGLCPKGWRPATDSDWNKMEKYLDPTVDTSATSWRGTTIGNVIKEAGNAHWIGTNTGTNTSGFTALPAGYRQSNGTFSSIETYAYFWTSTAETALNAYKRNVANNTTTVNRSSLLKTVGMSVRCIKKECVPGTVTYSQVDAVNGSGGSVSLEVNGGTSPFSFEWSNSLTNAQIFNLTPGIYSVTVTDANMCTSSLSVNIKNICFTPPAVQYINICEGTSYSINGHSYSVPGTYVDTLQNNEGCDSVVTTHLVTQIIADIGDGVAGYPLTVGITSPQVCSGQPVSVRIAPAQAGVYYSLIVNSTNYGNEFPGSNDTIFLPGPVVTAATSIRIYAHNVNNVCTLYLDTTFSITPVVSEYIDVSESICAGDSILIAGSWRNQVGVYSDFTRCDSVIRTHLFVVQPGETVTDTINRFIHDGRDCKNYPIVKIGNQWWMKENINTDKYADGSSIPYFNTNGTWGSLTTGAWVHPDNSNTANTDIYGRLYNWHAVNDIKGLCAQGWHVPTRNEWTQLFNQVGGQNTAAYYLKEAGSQHWSATNTANNSSGFTALAAGYKNQNLSWYDFGSKGYFWSADTSATGTQFAHGYFMQSNNSVVYNSDTYKVNGYSVRCLYTLPSNCVAVTHTQTIIKCDDNSFTVGSSVYFNPGTYVDTLTNSFGCDSIVTTFLMNTHIDDLHQNNLNVIAVNDTTCTGYYAELHVLNAQTAINYQLMVDGVAYGNQYTGNNNTIVLTSGIINSNVNLQVFAESPQTNCNKILDTTISIVAVAPQYPVVDVGICSGDSIFLANVWQKNPGSFVDFIPNSQGCDYRTTNLTVHSRPAVNLGNDTMLTQGASVTLHAGNTGSVYMWNNGSVTESITVSNAGMYYVDVANGGCVVRDTIIVYNPGFTVTSDYVPHAGIIKKMYVDTMPLQSLNYNAGGANAFWDFSGLVPHTSDTSFIVATESTPYGANFPASNIAMKMKTQSNGYGWAYYIKTPSVLQWIGYTMDLSGHGQYANLHLNDYMDCIYFPTAYNDSFSDPYALQQTINYAMPEFNVDQVRFDNQDTITRNYRAQGTLILPSGSYNVIREKSVEIKNDNTFLRINGMWSHVGSNTDTILTYTWMAENIPLPLVEMNIHYSTGSILKVKYHGGFVQAADFMASDTVVNANEAITFTDISSTPAQSWLWNFGDGTTSTLQNPVHSYAGTGTYNVTLTITSYGNQLTVTKNAYINVSGCNISVIASADTVICAGDSTLISASATSGSNPFLYVWSNGEAIQSVNVGVGVFYITITDANFCSGIDSVIILNGSPDDVSKSPELSSIPGIELSKDTVCYNENMYLHFNKTYVGVDYRVIINGIQHNSVLHGSNSPMDFYIAYNDFIAGTNDIVMTAINISTGCSITLDTILHVYKSIQNITVNLGPNTGICPGATVNLNAGNIGASYSWSNGSTNQILSISTPGTYSVTVSQNSCSVTDTIVISQFTNPVVVLTGDTSICRGESTVLISNVSGGTGPYSYNWSPGFSIMPTYTVSPIVNTNYSITVTDANNCKVQGTSQVYVHQKPVIAAILGGGIGTPNPGDLRNYYVAPAAGSSYEWFVVNGSFTTATNTNTVTVYWGNVGVGVLKVIETNVYGCVSDTVFSVFNIGFNCTGFQASLTAHNITCNNTCNGYLVANTTGGTSPYSYTWSSNASSQNLSTAYNLCAGSYTVTVTDRYNCTATATGNITQPSPISLTTSSSPANCGQKDGTATAEATGGILPYIYIWSNGMQGSNIDSLMAGSYIVSVTDGNGCSTFRMVQVNNAGNINISIDQATEPGCYGSTDGSISINVAGGNQPYQYSWSNGSTTEDISGLSFGPYDLTLTDASGCKGMLHHVLSQPEEIVVSPVVSHSHCGGHDGTITLTTTGGTQPYTYQWSTGANTVTIDSVSAGSYFVTVYDNHQCASSLNAGIVVGSNGGPTAILDSIIHTHCGSTTGGIYLHVTGGASPYTYEWSNTNTSQDLTGASTGIYNLTITDANGCKGTYSNSINHILPPQQQICMVTVDSASNKNLVIWEKVNNTGIDHYKIYKEGSMANVFGYAGIVEADSLSVWLDPISNPFSRSWRYKISAVDVCGNESPRSAPHKTIHLNQNQGTGNFVNLIWDNYDGYNYSYYLIYRWRPSQGTILLDTIPANLTSYTDFNVPSGLKRYFVTATRLDGLCAPLNYSKAEGGPFSQSSSNIEDNGIIDVGIANSNSGNETEILVYPNPVRDELVIEVADAKSIENNVLEITNILGQTIIESKLRGTSRISTLGLKSGVYIVKITNENGSFVRRIVKE